MTIREPSATKSFLEEYATLGISAAASCAPLHAAFHEFLKAFAYAHDLNADVWDFAIEISHLRRLRLSKSDLRWLVGRGLIEHRIETTLPGDAERSFKRPARLVFCNRTRFVLTPEGAVMGRQLRGSASNTASGGAVPLPSSPPLRAVALPSNPPVPTWDGDRQELRVGAVLVKRFRVPAASQEAVLAAFEEEHWPARIDDPLPPRGDQTPKRRLQETIKSLNRNQKHPLIRFLGDGNAQGVLWEHCSQLDETDVA